MALEPEAIRAIEEHVDKTIGVRLESALRWLALLGLPSIVALIVALVVMLFTLPGLIQNAVLARIESQRVVAERANNMALIAEDAFERVSAARAAILRDRSIIDAIENVAALTRDNKDDVLKFLTSAPDMDRSLSAQKYCVLHFQGARRDLYAVPIHSTSDLCLDLRKKVYTDDEPAHRSIGVEHGCLKNGIFEFGVLAFDGCGVSTAS
jgi:hypothetical protein